MENSKKKRETFQASLPENIHWDVKVAAAKAKMRISEWITEAIKLKIEDTEDGK